VRTLCSQSTNHTPVGVYANSGLSGYTVAEGSLPNNNTIIFGTEGPNFPVQWNPRYAYAGGMGANPDRRESYALNTGGIRSPATSGSDGYGVNPSDNPDGFIASECHGFSLAIRC